LQGVVVQAKNGDELFWEEKFHAAYGKAQVCTQGALHFFLLSLGRGGGGGRIFKKNFTDSQCVPNMFSLCSLEKFPMMGFG
jgi:hypothetical protein